MSWSGDENLCFWICVRVFVCLCICSFVLVERSREASWSGGVLVVSTSSICFPHLSLPIIADDTFLPLFFIARILLHETRDVTKENSAVDRTHLDKVHSITIYL